MIEHMLTTTDNPHDPFEDYEGWYAFDLRHGHNTASYLARVAVVSDEMSEADINFAIDQAIDEIVRENVNGLYKKISREVKSV